MKLYVLDNVYIIKAIVHVYEYNGDKMKNKI